MSFIQFMHSKINMTVNGNIFNWMYLPKASAEKYIVFFLKLAVDITKPQQLV